MTNISAWYEYFILVLMVPDKLVPNYSVLECTARNVNIQFDEVFTAF